MVKAANRQETHQSIGAASSEASASSHCIQNSAPTRNTTRTDGADAAGEVADHEPLDRADVGDEPGHHVAEAAPVVDVRRERQDVAKTSVRSSTRNRWEIHVAR